MRVNTLLLLGTVFIQVHAQDSRKYGTVEEWAKTLDKYAREAMESEEGVKAESSLKSYFQVFPSDFKSFHRIFGYQRDERGKTMAYPPVTHTLYGFLPELKALIPEEKYYKKMLGVGVGGVWDADEVNWLRIHLQDIVTENVSLSLEVLNEKKESEIRSFWHFLYDGPHPKDPRKREHFESLYLRVKRLDPIIAKQLKQAYEQLLSEYDDHGH